LAGAGDDDEEEGVPVGLPHADAAATNTVMNAATVRLFIASLRRDVSGWASWAAA
jgi:hypothetical protein